jgi:hypothetical protein
MKSKIHNVRRRLDGALTNSPKVFDSLLDACEQYVHSQNAIRLVGGVKIWTITMPIEG